MNIDNLEEETKDGVVSICCGALVTEYGRCTACWEGCGEEAMEEEE